MSSKKKLSKIKLTVLNRNEIADKEQRLLMGGGDYKCGCISSCLDELCQCFEDGGGAPNETVLVRFVSEPNRNHIENTTAQYNHDRGIMP